MEITTKESELFYIGCILSEAIEKVEKIIENNLSSSKTIMYDPHFQFLIEMKNKWVSSATSLDK